MQQFNTAWQAFASLTFDVGGRLSSVALAPTSRLFVPSLLLCAFFVAWLCRRLPVSSSSLPTMATLVSPSMWRTRSTLLDLQMLLTTSLLKATLAVAGFVTSRDIALIVSRQLRASFSPRFFDADPLLVSVVYTAVLFVCWDASRFAVHVAMHKVPWLWRFHAVHHSAETLTPLTLLRVHPVESVVMQLRGVLVTGALTAVFFTLFGSKAQQVTVLGVNALTLGCSWTLSNLRHSHVFLGWGIIEKVLVSPAQHQLHHSKDHVNINFGTWLSIWDQLYGSFVSSRVGPPRAFGVEGVRFTRLRDALLCRASVSTKGR